MRATAAPLARALDAACECAYQRLPSQLPLRYDSRVHDVDLSAGLHAGSAQQSCIVRGVNEGERSALLEWLTTSGQALELRVARRLMPAQLEVFDPFFYEDPSTREPREGDVVAWPRNAHRDEPRVVAVFECKYTEKQEKQWVGIKSSSRATRPRELGWQWLSWSGELCDPEFEARAVASVTRKGLLDPANHPCTKIETTHVKNNPAWNACRQALSAAQGLGMAELTSHGSYGPITTGVVVAVVVTTANLRVAALGRDGNMHVEATDCFEVLCPSPTGQLRPVLVMNESRLGVFAETLNH